MFARRAVKAVAISTVALFCVAGSLAIAGTPSRYRRGASGNTITNAVQAQSPFTAGTFDSGQPVDVVVPANSSLTPGRQHLHPRVRRAGRSRPDQHRQL